MRYCFGVDIGGTSIKIGCFTEDGKIEDKWEIKTRTEQEGSNILPDVACSIKAYTEEKKISNVDIIGVGLGVPGPINKKGEVLKCVNLGWGIFNVADKVRELTGISNVEVGNDANVAALGEVYQGGAKGYENIVMITLGTGVGGGVVLDNQIITGSNGAAGEIGHITVEPTEKEACNCGKHGCLEQFASATGIVKVAKRFMNEKEGKIQSSLYNEEEITAKVVLDAAKAGDEMAIDVVEQLGKYLGMACSHIAAVVDPDAFVIGGGVSKAGTILTDTIKKYYEKNVMYALQGKEFCLAKLGNDAGIYGCAKMVLDREYKR